MTPSFRITRRTAFGLGSCLFKTYLVGCHTTVLQGFRAVEVIYITKGPRVSLRCQIGKTGSGAF